METDLLKPLYEQALRGLPGLGTPTEMAAQYRREFDTLEEASDHLIGRYTALSGATGFVAGLPGILLMPVTVPADLAGNALLQLHMSAAMAAMADEDLTDPVTRRRCIACLTGKPEEDLEQAEVEETAMRTGIKLAERGVRFAAGQAVRYGVRSVRRRVLRKVGLSWVPVLGGILGLATDVRVTRRVGRCAQAKFLAPLPAGAVGASPAAGPAQ
jgi:hypothetical protein